MEMTMQEKALQLYRDAREKAFLLLKHFPHWKLFCTVFAISFACIVAVVLILPTKYESEMKLLVSSTPQDLVISPNDGKTSQGVQEMAENRVNSEIQVMTSRDVLRDVVLRSGLGHEPGTISAAGVPSLWYMQTAENSLERHLEIKPVKRSNVISVTYKARSPELATTVLTNLADSYMGMHARAHAKPGSFTFFDEQAKTFTSKLTDSENALQRFKEEHAYEDPNQVSMLTQKALEVEASLDQTNAEAADASGRIRRATQQIASIDPRVTAQVHTAPQTGLAAQLTAQLAELQNQKTQLSTKFLPGDRMIKQVDAEIAETQSMLDGIASRPVVETTTDLNQIRLGIEKELATSDTELEGLKARRTALTGILTDFRQRLADVAASTAQNDRLSREVRENEEAFLLYAKEREESRIADSLDQKRITDVTLVEAPTYQPQPASPVIPVDMAIGFLLSLMVAYLAVRAWKLISPELTTASATA